MHLSKKHVDKKDARLYDLIDSRDAGSVYKEIIVILNILGAGSLESRFKPVYDDIVHLFKGQYPGYRKSNTRYHNLEHTLLVTLAAARLLHGYVEGRAESGVVFKPANVLLCVLAALYHDSGLIQTKQDRKGTGAKYTIGHEARSVTFMRKNMARNGFDEKQMVDCEHLIMCTNLDLRIDQIPFRSPGIRILGQIVGTSDLLAQIADRQYLEKLMLLFKEFKEAGIPEFDSEEELLQKTGGFYKNVAKKRMEVDYDNISDCMIYHFRNRWDIDRDLYLESIENNIEYLKSMFKNRDTDDSIYRQFLKRGGIVDREWGVFNDN
ncbi:MAG: HD domain-containing protein [Deltaproteobacteria bacterium]|nr:HD domain-containing protein [Deltaproteobacteria bacterium]